MRLIDADVLSKEAGRLWSEMPDGEELSKELMKAINHAPTVGGWISVKDRLPEKRGFYLVYCYMHSNKVVGFAPVLEDVDMFDFAGVKESGWYEYDGETGYYEFMGVTHWMPLPEPPKEVYT